MTSVAPTWWSTSSSSALIALAVIGAVMFMRGEVINKFNYAGSKISNTPEPVNPKLAVPGMTRRRGGSFRVWARIGPAAKEKVSRQMVAKLGSSFPAPWPNISLGVRKRSPNRAFTEKGQHEPLRA